MHQDSILNAAAELISEGQSEFTMDQLAARAGVGRATLYRRYSSRQKVMEALKPLLPELAQAPERPAARARLLDALTVLLDRVGPLQVTVEQVAEAAQVNPVTLFRIFGDKLGMLRVWFEERSPRQAYDEVFANTAGSTAEVLTRLLTQMLKFSCQHPGMVRLLLFASPEERALMEDMNMVQGHTRARLLKFLEEREQSGELKPGSSRLLTLAIASIALGGPQLFSVRSFLADDPAAAARDIVRQLLEGALVQPSIASESA